MESNPLLSVESRLEKMRFYITNAGCIAGVVFSMITFRQNPTFFSIVLALLVFVFISLSYTQLHVYNDKLEIVLKGFWKFNTHTYVFYYNDINFIDTTFRYDHKRSLTEDVFYSVDARYHELSCNYFVIQPKTGKHRDFLPDVSKDKLIKAFELVKQCSHNSFEIKDLYREYPFW